MTWSTFLEIRRFHVYFEIVMGLLSYVLNFLVIYLAIYKSNKALQQYRVVIILSACVDLIFNTVNSFTMQLVDLTYGRIFFLNSGLLEHLPPPFGLASSVFWLFSLYLAIANVALTFFFRYKVLCCRKQKYLREFAKIYGACAFLIAILIMLGFVCLDTNETDPKYTVELKANGLFAEQTPPFRLNDVSTLKGATYIVCADLIVIISYVVVFWTGIQIHRMLKASREHMSRATLAVQRQLTIILIFQAVGPFLMLALPTLVGGCLPLLGIKAPGLGLVLSLMVTVLPLMNAITVIFVVPSFRRTILMRSGRSSTVDHSVRTEFSVRSAQFPTPLNASHLKS